MEASSELRRRPRRRLVRHGTIVRELRSEILTGRYARGDKLPTRTVLEERFQASSTTVQRALDRLIHEGFAFVKGRQGTFVVENPPHLCRYGLVFPRRPGTYGTWSRWWVSLQQQAMALQTPGAVEFATYYSDEGRQDSEDFQKLLRDVNAHRLAGLIFATPPFELRGTAVLDQPGLPRAAIMAAPVIPGMLCAFPDMESFFDRALGYLASRGRRRLAVIGADNIAALHHHVAPWIGKYGMETRPFWFHTVHPERADGARNVADLLMRLPAGDRPDGLIIADDNIADSATAGVVDSGVAVPGDVEIVAHCNFPWHVGGVRVTRLGFDARQIMSVALGLLDGQRQGSRPTPMTKVPALFEDELETPHPAPPVGGASIDLTGSGVAGTGLHRDLWNR